MENQGRARGGGQGGRTRSACATQGNNSGAAVGCLEALCPILQRCPAPPSPPKHHIHFSSLSPIRLHRPLRSITSPPLPGVRSGFEQSTHPHVHPARHPPIELLNQHEGPLRLDQGGSIQFQGAAAVPFSSTGARCRLLLNSSDRNTHPHTRVRSNVRSDQAQNAHQPLAVPKCACAARASVRRMTR